MPASSIFRKDTPGDKYDLIGGRVEKNYYERWYAEQQRLRESLLAVVMVQMEARASADTAVSIPTDASSTYTGVLTQPMAAMAVGDPVPVVFGRRRTGGTGGTGGVFVQPRATEVAISNTATTYSVSWHCVLSEGELPGVQVRDVRNGTTRDGAFSQRFGGRAGDWFAGNRTVPQAGQQLPAFPLQCGGGGDYEGVSTIEFRNTYPVGSDRWSQSWNVFCRGGIIISRGRLTDSVVGPSDNLCDLIIWALVASGRMSESDIDLPTMAATAAFLEAYDLHCNAEFRELASLPEFLTSILPFFLLRETMIDGKYAVIPLLPVNADGTIRTDVDPEFMLTEQSIAPGSYSENYPDAGLRGELEIVATYRQQTSDVEPPLVCTLQPFGRQGEANPARETIAMEGFATNRVHPAMVAGYRLAERKYGGRTASITLVAGDQTGFTRPGQICQISFNVVSDYEPPSFVSGYWMIDSVARAIDGSETLQLREVPVDDQGNNIVALQVLAARDLAGDAVFPYPVIGGADVAGRSTDTSVPPQIFNPSIVPFSRGGGQTGSPSLFVSGGGGGRVEMPPPRPPRQPKPPGPEEPLGPVLTGPVTRADGPPSTTRGDRGNPAERVGKPQICKHKLRISFEIRHKDDPSVVVYYAPGFGQQTFNVVLSWPDLKITGTTPNQSGTTYIYSCSFSVGWAIDATDLSKGFTNTDRVSITLFGVNSELDVHYILFGNTVCWDRNGQPGPADQMV
jgi:hypothetical protein